MCHLMAFDRLLTKKYLKSVRLPVKINATVWRGVFRIIDFIKRMLIKYRVFVTYVFFGCLSVSINFIVHWLCTLVLDVNIPVQLEICTIVAWFCAVVFSYCVDRRYVFKSKNSKGRESIHFLEMRVATLLLDMALMALLVSVFTVNDKIAKVIVQFTVFLVNYTISRLLVFKQKGTNNNPINQENAES